MKTLLKPAPRQQPHHNSAKADPTLAGGGAHVPSHAGTAAADDTRRGGGVGAGLGIGQKTLGSSMRGGSKKRGVGGDRKGAAGAGVVVGAPALDKGLLEVLTAKLKAGVSS